MLIHSTESCLVETLKETTKWELLFLNQVVIDDLLIVVQENFLVDKLLVLVSLETVQLKIKVESRNIVSCRLIVFKVEVLQVRMSQCFSNSNALLRVKRKHFLQ